MIKGLLISLLIVAPLSAQETHPCDITYPLTVQVRRSDVVKLGFCYASKDDDGMAIPLGQTQFLLFDGPTQIWDMGLMQPVGSPSVSGLYYYENQNTFSLKSDNLFTVVAVYDTIRSLPSTPLIVDVRGGPLSPVGQRIIQ